MGLNKYFYGTRMAKKGGLMITETSCDFPEELVREVERRCLELTAPDMETMPVSVYPWKERYLVMYAKKVPGDQDDPRPHEQIWGILLEADEFRDLNSVIFTEPFAVFIREQKGGNYEKTEFSEKLERNLEERDSMKWKVTLFYVLIDIIEKRQKIQISVSDNRNLQALVYSLLPDEFSSRLYTISDGECPQSQADILFTENFYYQKRQDYKKLNLEKRLAENPIRKEYVYFNQLIAVSTQSRNEAYRMFKIILSNTKEAGSIDSRLKIYDCLAAVYLFWKKDEKVEWNTVKCKLESLIRRCPQLKSDIIKMYPIAADILKSEEKKDILSKETSELFFNLDQYLDRKDESREITNKIRLTYAKAGEQVWQECQISLRQYLEKKKHILVKKREKFGQLLILAFQNYQEICFGKNSSLCFVPCDLQGMLLFLERLHLRRTEKKAVTEAIWKIHNEIFQFYGIERQMEINLKHILSGEMEGKYE